MFNLCGNNEKLTVELQYVKQVHFEECKNHLETFCQYLFEQVFAGMTAGIESMLKIDVEQSTFKLLPCLLKGKLIRFVLSAVLIDY